MAETNVADGRVFDGDGQLVAVAGQEIPKDAKGPLVYEDHFATAAAPVPVDSGDEPVAETEEQRTETGQGSKHAAKARSAAGAE